jgi:hypothetical protein
MSMYNQYQCLWSFVMATLLFIVLLPNPAVAECPDFDAMDAANKKALSYFKNGAVFYPPVVLKVHHPSRKKEVASYIKVDDKRYSIFTLVDLECGVRFLKRTRQLDE